MTADEEASLRLRESAFLRGKTKPASSMNPPSQNTPEKDPQTYAIIGTAMEVHRELGSGFLEAVYQEAMAVELEVRQIPSAREALLPIRYKGQPLPCQYKADFICFGEIVVELKALDDLAGKERAQIINYLKATGFTRGLLFNFGAGVLQYERFVLNHPR
jgi:GxxExxY protein